MSQNALRESTRGAYSGRAMRRTTEWRESTSRTFEKYIAVGQISQIDLLTLQSVSIFDVGNQVETPASPSVSVERIPECRRSATGKFQEFLMHRERAVFMGRLFTVLQQFYLSSLHEKSCTDCNAHSRSLNLLILSRTLSRPPPFSASPRPLALAGA